MSDDFGSLFEDLKQAGEWLARAGQHQDAAIDALRLSMAAIIRAAEAALDAQEQIRSSVLRLEGLVLELLRHKNG